MTFSLRKLDVELFELDKRWLLALASTIIASNLILNNVVLERFAAPDGHLVPGTKSFIVQYNLFSLTFGVGLAIVAFRLREFRKSIKLHQVLAAFVVSEVLLRVAIFTDLVPIRELKNPRLYSLGSCGDDGYFVLRHYYDRELPNSKPHPTLGWVRGVGELEIITDRYFSMSDIDRRPLLFFGDSFVGWGQVMDEKLPQLLEARLDGFNVLNYGVPGYATDQISLRAQTELPKFEGMRPLVLIGVFLDDLDRSLLTYRLSQKPHYELDEGKLVLQVPRYPTNREFFDRFHFHGKSFAVSPLLVLFGKFFRAEDWCSTRRETLNRAIFQDLESYLRSSGIEHHFVVFYSQNQLGRVSTMEKELRSIFADLGIDGVIDTKPMLMNYLRETGAPRTSLYGDGGAGHHTPEARRLLADGIAEYLSRAGERDN